MVTGVVTKSTGSWYNVRLVDGSIIPCRIKGKFRLGSFKVTNPVAVGDIVDIVISSEDPLVGTIRNIHPRQNYVIRESPRKKHHVHLISANVDQAIVLVTLRCPKVKIGFIDRFLLMTEPYDIPVTIIFNKADLYTQDDMDVFAYLKAVYENIGFSVLLISAVSDLGMDDLRALLDHKTTLISGQSGVGKTTVINRIAPHLNLKTQEISNYSGKGQHTTTFAEMFSLDDHTFIIDTPGIKSLSFNHLKPTDVAHNFREFFILSQDCKFNDCLHKKEPKCAVKQALENGEISPIRYENYLDILSDIEKQNHWEIQDDI